jgi:hypothetical protein
MGSIWMIVIGLSVAGRARLKGYCENVSSPQRRLGQPFLSRVSEKLQSWRLAGTIGGMVSIEEQR